MADEEPKKKKYNTQELLSLNMDRLKEYMKEMGKKVADPDSPPLFEVPPPKSKGGTRIGKTPSACRLLGIIENPLIFVNFVSANDERPPSRRYGLDRGKDFHDAVRRMTRHLYDIVIVTPMELEIEQVEEPFRAVDWILLIRGLMPAADVYFLAKKRWFVMELVDGATNAQKVENFRALREAYKAVPIVYLHKGEADDVVKVVDKTPKVRIVRLDSDEFFPLFHTLDELAIEG
ncbi:MAG: hypothetical protein ACYTHM_15605 [Planctomycetota bacterium]